MKNRLAAWTQAALRWEVLAWLVLAGSAAVTRFWNLGARVMSHDESLHAYFSSQLARGGGYAHNPMMHGPLLFEATAVFDAIFGANDFTSRILPALFGIALVVVIPLLLRPWLGRLGAFCTGLLFLVSPYILYYSRYNRHDIEEITWALLAACAILAYLRARAKAEPEASGGSDFWLLVLAGALAFMFSAQETAFFYLAIFAAFLLVKLLVGGELSWGRQLGWSRIRASAEFDLLVVMATLGAFFSAPIALLALNPLWMRVTGQPFVMLSVFNTFGTEWSTGPYGTRIWGLMALFWVAATLVGLWWGRIRWLKLAGLFMVITVLTFTTFLSNKNGIGTGYVGSLGYWLSQQGVARGSQPWYYYFIVFPMYEYLPIIGGVAAAIYIAVRRRSLSATARTYALLAVWWAFWIFTGLTAAGEKMPWLSTHITVPLILLTGWLLGEILFRGFAFINEEDRLPRAAAVGALVLFALLFLLTARTSYLVNYVNYDLVTEYIDYAHGAPGVKWVMADVNAIAAKTGEGSAMPVAYDNQDSWPLAWYLRDRPGFYGDQPNRDALSKAPVIIAGSENWQKVEPLLSQDYNRYEVIRIWWPLEDYKNLTWDRIRGALTNPQMRQAVWNILWSRDYSLYAKVTGEDLQPPAQWPLQDRMRIYIRKDLAQQIPNLKLSAAQIADLPPKVDAYAGKRVTLTPTQTIQPEGLNGARNLAMAPDGSVFVADSGNARILHMDAQGKILSSWGGRTPDKQTPPAPGTFNEPWGISVDAQGSVYVADTWNHRIQKFDSSGKFLLQWGTAGLSSEGQDRFWGPRGIAVAPDGNLYITDTGNRRVVVYNPQGKFLFAFAEDGDARLNEPVGIAVDKTGRVFVADTWNLRVAVFDLQGKFQTSWPVSAWSTNTINDKPFLALDGAGKVYLTDPEAGRVLVFSDQGAPLAEFGQIGSEPTSFNLPTGLLVSPQGSLWVADAGNNRIEVYPTVKP